MRVFALAAYLILSIIHLIDSWNDDRKKRARTKPFLLIFLLLFYLTDPKPWSVFLILALLTSWLGDVLLIPKGHGWFTAGGISFMLSHFFFVLVYFPQVDFRDVQWLITALSAVLYFGISRIIIKKTAPTTPKKMVLPMNFYLLCNSTMNLFAMMQLFTLKNKGAAIAYAGAVLFFISDCTLFLVRYYKNPDVVFRKHFTVMLTYLAGEFFITLGMMMVLR